MKLFSHPLPEQQAGVSTNMRNEIKNKPAGQVALHRLLSWWLACCLWFGIGLAGAAPAPTSVWLSDQQGVYQLSAEGAVLQTPAIVDVSSLAADGKGGAWAASRTHLHHLGEAGSAARSWRLDALGLHAPHLRADPYDGSLWLSEGTRVLHLGAGGDILSDFAVATPVQDLALALDQTPWILGADGPLRHYDRQGSLLASLATPDAMRETSRQFAVDSMRQRIWLWNTVQLVQLDLNSGAQQRSFSLLPATVSTVLDPASGTLWSLSGTALTAYSATGFPQSTALGALDIADPYALAHDAANHCLWIGHTNGLSRLDLARHSPATLIATVPALHIGATPFAPGPILSLLAPASNRLTAGAHTSFVLGVDPLCFSGACQFSAEDLKHYRIDAMLGQQPIGEQFVFDASDRTFRYAAALPASGRISFLAQAIDPFGHGSNLIDETLELGSGADAMASAGNAVAAAHTPPTVSITAPLNNAAIMGPATVAITANAAASGATITKVAFYNGTTLLGNASSSSAPYTYSWTNVAVGSYTLTAKATDSLGSVTTSAAVKITVTHPAPTVSITAPANNASINGPATVALSANAATIGATITKVAFYNGTTLLGNAALSSTPYTYSWTNVAVGSYTLTAKVTDSLGATATSAVVNLTVKAHVAPTVSITAPANNSSVAGPATLAIAANAAASGATISRIDFYNGTTLLGTAAQSFQHIGILSLEFHVDKLSRPLL